MRSGTATACPRKPVWSIPREEPTAHDADGKLPASISRRRNRSIVTTGASLHRNRGAASLSIGNFPAESIVYAYQIRVLLVRGLLLPSGPSMFRLEKLEINGFKSFHDPANLPFPAAMTAVVGPNGCGKSNICDAIIWVLGENRASHIRGETMDDVIFQGSARRRPLSMGEVTLTLAATNGDSNNPAADEGKITINRRVFRTGEPEFRLNGRRVRLKDISDIRMDTAPGSRNHSVMEQGKIDL